MTVWHASCSCSSMSCAGCTDSSSERRSDQHKPANGLLAASSRSGLDFESQAVCLGELAAVPGRDLTFMCRNGDSKQSLDIWMLLRIGGSARPRLPHPHLQVATFGAEPGLHVYRTRLTSPSRKNQA